VPSGKRDVTGFDQVALRIGPFSALPAAAVANSEGEEINVLIGLHDGAATSWHWIDPVIPNDLRPGGATHSVMATRSMTLGSFSNIDKSNIEAVFLAVPGNTQGTLLVDSLEWWRD